MSPRPWGTGDSRRTVGSGPADRLSHLSRRTVSPAALLSPSLGLYYAMRVIALRTLKRFLDGNPQHADARDPALAWYQQVRTADWATPADVKRDMGSASILKDGRVAFNVAGNKYRIVVWINYSYYVVYIRFVGTHAQYDRIDAQTI